MRRFYPDGRDGSEWVERERTQSWSVEPKPAEYDLTSPKGIRAFQEEWDRQGYPGEGPLWEALYDGWCEQGCPNKGPLFDVIFDRWCEENCPGKGPLWEAIERTLPPDEDEPAPSRANELPPEYLEAVRKKNPRPATWDGVIGNTKAVEIVREAMVAAQRKNQPVPHLLLIGQPGTGKSTIAKMVAATSGGGCIETTASTLETPADVIGIINKLNVMREQTGKPSVLFLDEIHRLSGPRGRQARIDPESIYSLLEDWNFPHPLAAKQVVIDGRKYRGIASPMLAWPFTLIGATTDPGMLSDALRRRFLIHVEMEAYSDSDIETILIGAAERLGATLDSNAAKLLASYSRGTPGRAYQLLVQAQSRADATGETISRDVAKTVIDRLGLYPMGLTPNDVRALKFLKARGPKGMGQNEIAKTLGISTGQWSEVMEGYLRQLGFVETLSRRVITQAGIQYLERYGS